MLLMNKKLKKLRKVITVVFQDKKEIKKLTFEQFEIESLIEEKNVSFMGVLKNLTSNKIMWLSWYYR